MDRPRVPPSDGVLKDGPVSAALQDPEEDREGFLSEGEVSLSPTTHSVEMLRLQEVQSS